MEAAALAVLGTLGGAIVGALGALGVERRRQQHDLATRWQTDRRELYARVLATADEYIEAMRTRVVQLTFIAAGRMPDHQADPRPDNAAFMRAYHEAELLASMRVRLDLLYLHLTVVSLSFHGNWDEAHGWGDSEGASWKEATDAFIEARRRVFEAAQADLGVTSPQRPSWLTRAWAVLTRRAQ